MGPSGAPVILYRILRFASRTPLPKEFDFEYGPITPERKDRGSEKTSAL